MNDNIHTRRNAAAWLAFGLSLAPALAGTVMLRPLKTLQCNQLPLAPSLHAIPCATDWNGDGFPDLIVGYQYAGKLALYMNAESNIPPVFNTWSNLQVNGADITHLSPGNCGAPAPWVCDYDNDGRRDLLVGRGSDGQVFFYKNTNPSTNPGAYPILAPGVPLRANGATLTVPERATPYVHDWDEDGRQDLLCGAGNGQVYWYRNIGSKEAPVYGVASILQAGGVILNLGIRSTVRVYDWDGDGLKDLIGGGYKKVSWCRNTNSNPAPQLAAPVTLQAPENGLGLQPIMDQSDRNRIELADWNADGVVDLLVGAASGPVVCFEGYAFAFNQVTAGPDGQCTLQWNSADFLRYNLLAGSSFDYLWDVVATNLPSGGKTTAWTNSLTEGQRFFKVELAR